MSDGMGRELAYLSSHATNRYFIPNWGRYCVLQIICQPLLCSYRAAYSDSGRIVRLSVKRNHPFSHEYLLMWWLMY